MIFPRKMKKLTAAILQEDADSLTKNLLNLGVMEFLSVTQAEEGLSQRVTSLTQTHTPEDLEDLRRRIEMFLALAHIAIPDTAALDAQTLTLVTAEDIKKQLDKLTAEIQLVRDSQQALQQEILRLQELKQQVGLFSEISNLLPSGAYVEVAAGLLGKSKLVSLEQGLKGFPAYLQVGELTQGTAPDHGGESKDEYPILLITMHRDADRVGKLLDRLQWQSIEIPREFRGAKATAMEALDAKLAKAHTDQQQLAKKVEDLVRTKQQELQESWKHLRMRELFLTMQNSFGKTGRTVLFSGWLPLSQAARAEQVIRTTTQDRCVLEWSEPELNASIKREEVPVQMEHAEFLKPFQWLVTNYSVPQYGTIDPTFLVFFTYLVMFGLMFGDAGQGLVLVLAGALMVYGKRLFAKGGKKRGAAEGAEGDPDAEAASAKAKAKTSDKAKARTKVKDLARARNGVGAAIPQDTVQQEIPQSSPGTTTVERLGLLIMWCGAAAIVMGVLFGSYFGYGWFAPLWFDYHGIVTGAHAAPGGNGFVTSIYDILGITLKFGIGIITAGILLNCVNRFRAKQWVHLIFDNGGVLALWFYLGGVFAGSYFVQTGYKELPGSSFLLFSMGLPLLLFLAKGPVEYLHEHRAEAHGKGGFDPKAIPGFLMQWVIELLELFTGYLSNTLSFMRIAGLGIAHVSLMVAFFQIAGSVPSPVGSAVILILGNLIVIVLEGLSAGIQALRLHYYEFFSKYFCGSGKVYKPITLRKNG